MGCLEPGLTDVCAGEAVHWGVARLNLAGDMRRPGAFLKFL